MDARLGRPQTVNLRELLDQTLSTETPDLTSLKQLLLGLIEDGQRHTMHGNRAPEKGKHPCARQRPGTTAPSQTVCRYLYPKELISPKQAEEGVIHSDPFRAGLYNLLLARNDPLVNNFETHLLLANL